MGQPPFSTLSLHCGGWAGRLDRGAELGGREPAQRRRQRLDKGPDRAAAPNPHPVLGARVPQHPGRHLAGRGHSVVGHQRQRVGQTLPRPVRQPGGHRSLQRLGLPPPGGEPLLQRDLPGVELLAVAAQRLNHRQHGGDYQPARAGQHMRHPVLSARRQPVVQHRPAQRAQQVQLPGRMLLPPDLGAQFSLHRPLAVAGLHRHHRRDPTQPTA